MTDIELIVTDLDGTLWELPDATPLVTTAALQEVMGGPVPLLVATGRRIVSTREPLAALGVAPPAIVLNGGLGLDLGSGDRFHVGGFTAEEAALVLAQFSLHGIDPCIYVNHDTPSVFVSATPSTHPRHLASFRGDVVARALDEVVRTEAVLAFGVLGIPAEVATSLGAELASVAAPHVAPDRQYGGHTITVAPSGASKWDGIAAFCAAHELDAGRVLVMGDGPNDVEMLAKASVALVPRDGHPDALALATHVIPRADDAGWAEVLDHL